jgi:hypothetical protein
MLVWKGWGILGILIPAAMAVVGDLSLETLWGRNYNADAFRALFLLASGAAVWAVGRKLNGKPGRKLVDPKTGETVEIKETHTLFWLPVQWFGVIWLLLGLGLLAKLYV